MRCVLGLSEPSGLTGELGDTLEFGGRRGRRGSRVLDLDFRRAVRQMLRQHVHVQTHLLEGRGERLGTLIAQTVKDDACNVGHLLFHVAH